MRSKTISISEENRARFFWGLVAISLLSVIAYIYAINATARYIALRQELEREITEITTSLDALEFKHISLQNNVTIELAYQYGFHEAKAPLYLSSRQDSLSFNTLER